MVCIHLFLLTVYLKPGYWRLQRICAALHVRIPCSSDSKLRTQRPFAPESITLPSSLLRPHVPILKPLDNFFLSSSSPCSLYHSTAGLQDLPDLILCVSFPRCLDPYPGSPHGAFTRFFPCSFGLLPVRIGSADTIAPYSDFSTDSISGLQSFSYVQAPRFAHHSDFTIWQP